MADDRDGKEQGFKISDRRKFNPDGTLRDQPVEEPAESAPGIERDSPAEAGSARVLSFPGETVKRKEKAEAPGVVINAQESDAKREYEESFPRGGSGLPEPSFESLVNMLAVEAVMHLGLIENPMGGRSVDLEAARHMIDMLAMLDEKTRGNLAPDEAELMENVLADLRMQFVTISRRK
ncbi:MAG TPA: DUF1844 domain-containing protein [Blastocatellia bacterium]|nr:DUF1844 domain-containing protein [Blastocatellia bacterium]